ncbi:MULTISPECIES: ketoacyl-ACP synthase III [unclassified Thiocapsa]|uniref:ketoacyl-ACP synthase III n=1 Tax=unclassified Thiocapsa TaxID=2641286 RepID=UPI0035B09553
MIGIRAIASYLPETRLDNLRQAEKFGETPAFINDKIGAIALPVKDAGQEASDLAVKAVERLCSQHGLAKVAIDALVVVTQNPDGAGLPHTAAILQRKLDLPTTVAAFDISLGCSGFVYGLSIVRGLMDQAGLKNGVLVTADPYSRVIDREDRITSLLFGDAATATWLCEDSPWTFGRPLLETDGKGADTLFVDQGRLRMNGREVFNFAAVRVPQQISRWLSDNDLEPNDIDLYCLHQGSASIVDAISRRFPQVRDRFLKDIRETGNTVSSSIPLLLEKYVLGSAADRVLICGFGVGLSWATNLIQKVTQDD